MPSPTSQHWRERARNALAVAEWMEPEAQRLLLEIAERYERIAVLAQGGDAKFVVPDRLRE